MREALEMRPGGGRAARFEVGPGVPPGVTWVAIFQGSGVHAGRDSVGQIVAKRRLTQTCTFLGEKQPKWWALG